MNKFLFSLLLLLFISIMQLVAQSDVKIKKNEFMKGKPGFKEAWDHVNAGEDSYVRKGSFYNNAFDHFIQALVYNNSNPELNYKTGIAAIYTDRKEEASGFFLKALEIKKNVADDILLYTGRALQYAGRYDEAIDNLENYLKAKVDKTDVQVNLAKRFIEECNSARLLTKDSLNIIITNLGANVNSESDDFSPVVTFDGKTIYFASQRKSKKLVSSDVSPKLDENIYVTRLTNRVWGISSPAGEELNTDYNESPLYIDSAGLRLYVYSGFENGGDIKVSVCKKGEWRTPESLPLNINTIGSETAINFSRSGNEIYYITNEGKDNLGGYDIYFMKKISDKKWTKPQNIGHAVNTTYDEQSVSLSKSGDTLWFSSKGHNSMGGFDIFYSLRNQDGTWNQAVNAGYPINTVWDELYHISPPSSDSLFYFVSSRSGGFGGLDIYKGRILPKISEKKSEVPSVPVAVPMPVPVPDTLRIADSISVKSVSDTLTSEPPAGNSEASKPESESPDKKDFNDRNREYFIRED
jgi:tetratricopeptide (TPR) repeat protein